MAGRKLGGLECSPDYVVSTITELTSFNFIVSQKSLTISSGTYGAILKREIQSA